MSGASDQTLAALEQYLERAERSFSALQALDAQQAARVGERMERLASQLLEVSPPPVMDAVHARLGTTPASPEDFAALTDDIGPPDGEG